MTIPPEFAEELELLGDMLADWRDVDALQYVGDAIALRDQVKSLGRGGLAALGPLELAQLCDRWGERRLVLQLIEALRGAYEAAIARDRTRARARAVSDFPPKPDLTRVQNRQVKTFSIDKTQTAKPKKGKF